MRYCCKRTCDTQKSVHPAGLSGAGLPLGKFCVSDGALPGSVVTGESFTEAAGSRRWRAGWCGVTRATRTDRGTRSRTWQGIPDRAAWPALPVRPSGIAAAPRKRKRGQRPLAYDRSDTMGPVDTSTAAGESRVGEREAERQLELRNDEGEILHLVCCRDPEWKIAFCGYECDSINLTGDTLCTMCVEVARARDPEFGTIERCPIDLAPCPDEHEIDLRILGEVGP